MIKNIVSFLFYLLVFVVVIEVSWFDMGLNFDCIIFCICDFE